MFLTFCKKIDFGNNFHKKFDFDKKFYFYKSFAKQFDFDNKFDAHKKMILTTNVMLTKK